MEFDRPGTRGVRGAPTGARQPEAAGGVRLRAAAHEPRGVRGLARRRARRAAAGVPAALGRAARIVAGRPRRRGAASGGRARHRRRGGLAVAATQPAPVVAITGAAGGIGSALARRWARDGAQLVLLDRDQDALDALAREFTAAGIEAVAIGCDITDEAACRAALRRVQEVFGRLDVLVNNAGITALAAFEHTAPATFRRLWEVNFLGAIHCTLPALPLLERSGGQVVVISSVAGFAPLLGRAAYAASKHALHGAFDTLRAEWAARGVGVTIVCPSYTDTAIVRRALDGAGRAGAAGDAPVASRMMAPSVLADRIVAGVRRRRRLLLPSWTARGAWWVSRVSGALYDRLMRRNQARMQGAVARWTDGSRGSDSRRAADSRPRPRSDSVGCSSR
ncbi:MAG: SDR family oxidoreductase [Planctomycetota bacterium]|nr:MAG: SDR family oxidoreductase [Planctomycetota bacterium]